MPSTPKFRLPIPSGPYSIGTEYLYFIDENRPDTYTSDPDGHREISLRVWYPAEPKPNEIPMNYMNEEVAKHFVKGAYVNPSFVDEVALRPSNSYLKAKVAKEEDSYPVILFSASGLIDGHSMMAEELASHGYVIFCIGHPYWNAYYFDADGEAFLPDHENEYYKRMWEEENSEVVIQTKEQLTRATTAKDKLALQRQLNKHLPAEICDIRLWVEDIGFIIDELEKMNLSDESFKGKLDLNSIGVIGYSKGGAAAGQVCLTDARCRAGINLSGFMFGDIGEKELVVPFMVIENVEGWCKDALPINDLLFHTSKSSIYMVQINDSTHANFSDVSAWGEYLFTRDDLLGPIDGRRFLKIQNDYVLQFFNKHLKGLPAPLLDGPTGEYPEVRFKSRHN